MPLHAEPEPGQLEVSDGSDYQKLNSGKVCSYKLQQYVNN